MSHKLQWGILGTGSIAGALARAVPHSRQGELRAVASRSQEKAEAFADQYSIPSRHGSYENLLTDPEVEAVYIATPHPVHAEWVIRCAEAGKHILCEKPLTLNAYDTAVCIETARRNDVFLMEAFMYRCHPQTQKLVELLREGAVGEVRLIRASFGYHAGYNPESRIFSNKLGGGGILDVGCYPTSVTRLIAGVALGGESANPVKVQAAGQLNPETGTDEYTAALLSFENNIIAQVSTSVRLQQDSRVTVFGTEGNLVVESPWFCSGKEGGTSRILLNRKGEEPRPVLVETEEWLYGIEADHVATNLENRQGCFPAMTWDDTLGNMRTLDQWRAAIGMVYEQEKPEKMTTPIYARPLSRRKDHRMRYERIPGLEKDISKIVLGTLAQGDFRHAATMYDDFYESGGTCFDTALIYGGGKSETNLGQWVKNRGIQDELVIITKGCHSPNNFPGKLSQHIQTSFERLQMDSVDIYFLHRDNLDVPVGEWIDALNEHRDAGRMSLFGGSNWTMERVIEANEYAARNGKVGFLALSNNFSLAQMVKPVWPGCLASSTAEFKQWHIETQMPLFPWSSQARGFFVPGRARPDLKDDATLVRAWYSEDNFERQRRCFDMAEKRGVPPISIALAYVLHQPFPCFPLIGPVSVAETTTSLQALEVELSPEDLKYLNLEEQ